MASKLPVIKANTHQDNIDKMRVISKFNHRSISKELEFLIEKHILEHEKKYGKINLVSEMSLEEQVQSIGCKACPYCELDDECINICHYRDSNMCPYGMGLIW